MSSFNDLLSNYKAQLSEGDTQKAHQGLLRFMLSLRNEFKKRLPSYGASANFYQGYMDVSFFTVTVLSEPEIVVAKKFVDISKSGKHRAVREVLLHTREVTVFSLFPPEKNKEKVCFFTKGPNAKVDKFSFSALMRTFKNNSSKFSQKNTRIFQANATVPSTFVG